MTRSDADVNNRSKYVRCLVVDNFELSVSGNDGLRSLGLNVYDIAVSVKYQRTFAKSGAAYNARQHVAKYRRRLRKKKAFKLESVGLDPLLVSDSNGTTTNLEESKENSIEEACECVRKHGFRVDGWDHLNWWVNASSCYMCVSLFARPKIHTE